jgi:predicted nucleic-acid-binding protein
MVALDTNILIRFLTRDDPSQYQTSVTIFRTEEVFLSDTVLLETGWVLGYAYGYKPAQICEAISKLCGLPNVHLANAEQVQLALAGVETGLDWADAFHWALADGCSRLLTFDQRFAQRAHALKAKSIPVVVV